MAKRGLKKLEGETLGQALKEAKASPVVRARGAGAVMSQRATRVPDGLDDFPTPPFGCRALERFVLPEIRRSMAGKRVWEPAAGRGIMAACFREAGAQVTASDVHRYPDGEPLDMVGSFTGDSLLDGAFLKDRADIIATNPPFNLALDFAERALRESRDVVALLCRSNWAEGAERYERLFKPRPPVLIAHYVERVPMTEGGVWRDEDGQPHIPHRGGYDPEASTATAYSWFVWAKPGNLYEATEFHRGARTIWIPPCKELLTKPDDAHRFGKIRVAEAML